jgi:hypothetical protein
MNPLFLKRVKYYSFAFLVMGGIPYLAYLFFINFILKDECTDGATFFVYWIIVLFILYAVGLDFYNKRPRKKY